MSPLLRAFPDHPVQCYYYHCNSIVNMNNRKKAKGRPDLSMVIWVASAGSYSFKLPREPVVSSLQISGEGIEHRGRWVYGLWSLGDVGRRLPISLPGEQRVGEGADPIRKVQNLGRFWLKSPDRKFPSLVSCSCSPLLLTRTHPCARLPCGFKQPHGPWRCRPHTRWIAAGNTS